MIAEKKINLKLKNQSVPIHIGNKLLQSFDVSPYVKNKNVVIVTNSTVGKLYLKQTKRLFNNYKVDCLLIPDGEKYKNRDTLDKIHSYLLKQKYDRSLTIVALGGGVIGDMVAFAADTFMRGVSLIHIPTTLLAQVDSSIGGKCGINHARGKNLIGSVSYTHLRAHET